MHVYIYIYIYVFTLHIYTYVCMYIYIALYMDTIPPPSGVVSLVPTPRMHIYINDVKFRHVRVKIYIICRPPCRPPCRPHDGQIWVKKQNCFCVIP